MRLYFRQQQAEAVSAGERIRSRNFYGMNGHAKPGVRRTGEKKILDGITGDGEREGSRNHGVNSDDAAACIGKRTARVSGRETNVGLHPRSRAKSAERANRVNHT